MNPNSRVNLLIENIYWEHIIWNNLEIISPPAPSLKSYIWKLIIIIIMVFSLKVVEVLMDSCAHEGERAATDELSNYPCISFATQAVDVTTWWVSFLRHFRLSAPHSPLAPTPIEPEGTYARSPSPEPPYLGCWLPFAITKTPPFPGFRGKFSRD